MILLIPVPLAARPYNYDYTSTRREKCMEYFRHNVVQRRRSHTLKELGYKENKKVREYPTHIWQIAPYKASPRLLVSTYYKALQWNTDNRHAYCC